MQPRKIFAFVCLLLVAVNCNYDYEYWTEGDNSIQYSYLPTNALGTFEGSYTSVSHLGYELNICLVGTYIYGSYDQLGIFNGNVSSTNVATGNWYQAGNTDCVQGTFQLTLNSDGFTGYYTCTNNPTKYAWNETKLSPFRPDDLDCALMNVTNPITLKGRYVDSAGLPKDFCYGTNRDNATISFLYFDSNNIQQKGYFAGYAYEKGQVYLGTWYTLQPLAGADLYYLDNNGVVHGYYWTGLNGTHGVTLINPGEYYQPEYHNARYYTGPISTTETTNCDNYESIKTKVLNNLTPYNNGADYFFVGTYFNYLNDDDGGVDDDGANDDEIYYIYGDASHLRWCFLPILLALFI